MTRSGKDLKRFWTPIINDFQPLVTVRPAEPGEQGELREVDAFYVDRAAGDPTRSTRELLKEGLLASL